MLNKNFKSEPKFILLIAFLSSLALLYFTYSPLLHIPFYHHDSYKFTVGGFNTICAKDCYGYPESYTNARPITAWLDCMNFKLANTPEKMSLIRLACVVFLSLFSSVFIVWLMRSGLSLIVSLAITIMLFCLPGMQTSMIMGSTSLISSPFLAFVAYLLINKSFEVKERRNKFLLFFCGCLTLISSLLTYPSLSGFFLVPALISILFNPITQWQTNRNRILMEIGCFIFCSVLFFFIAKIMQALLITGIYPGGYTFNINFELIARLGNLFIIFPSLWNIYYDNWMQGIIVYTLVGFGLLLSWKKINSNPTYQILSALLVLIAIVSNAYLLQPSNMVFARILYIFQIASILILLWALLQIHHHFVKKTSFSLSLLMIFFALISMNTAHFFVYKSALNDRIELSYITSFLADRMTKIPDLKQIHVIGLPFESTFNFTGMRTRDDIFNTNSTLYRQDSYFMIHAALKKIDQNASKRLYNCALDEFQLMKTTVEKCMAKAPRDSIVVTYSRGDEPFIRSENTLVINMTPEFFMSS